jgi:hypothetical protein
MQTVSVGQAEKRGICYMCINIHSRKYSLFHYLYAPSHARYQNLTSRVVVIIEVKSTKKNTTEIFTITIMK